MDNKKKNSSRPKVIYGRTMKVQTGAGVLSFSDQMRAKMSGMLALGTAAYLSPICQARQQNEKLVCSHCYTKRTFIYPSTRPMYERNTKILTGYLLPNNEIPVIQHPLNICRFENLGETQNVIQALNYLRIAALNPKITFSVWTKNPGFYKTALKTVRKPKNLIIIYSSIFVNVEQYKVLDRFPFVDKVFTVYSKDYLKEHPEIKINCGARSCVSCMKCYKKNTAKLIHELIK